MIEEIKEHMKNCIDREESCLLNTDNTKKLLEEIERLKEDIRVFKFTIKTQQEQIQELIAREDKAIEYIEKNTDNTNFLEVPSKELLEILDKVDKENI